MLEKDHTKLQFFSNLIKKMFVAVLIQISFIGIIQVSLYKTDSTTTCLEKPVRIVLMLLFFNSIFKSL